MNRDSNTYTILYAAIMVVVVAIALALTAVALRKPQQENERIDKMQQILRAVHLEPTKDQVIPTYTKVIKQELLVNGQGEVIATFEGDQIAQNEALRGRGRATAALHLPDGWGWSMGSYLGLPSCAGRWVYRLWYRLLARW